MEEGIWRKPSWTDDEKGKRQYVGSDFTTRSISLSPTGLLQWYLGKVWYASFPVVESLPTHVTLRSRPGMLSRPFFILTTELMTVLKLELLYRDSVTE